MLAATALCRVSAGNRWLLLFKPLCASQAAFFMVLTKVVCLKNGAVLRPLLLDVHFDLLEIALGRGTIQRSQQPLQGHCFLAAAAHLPRKLCF